MAIYLGRQFNYFPFGRVISISVVLFGHLTPIVRNVINNSLIYLHCHGVIMSINSINRQLIKIVLLIAHVRCDRPDADAALSILFWGNGGWFFFVSVDVAKQIRNGSVKSLSISGCYSWGCGWVLDRRRNLLNFLLFIKCQYLLCHKHKIWWRNFFSILFLFGVYCILMRNYCPQHN